MALTPVHLLELFIEAVIHALEGAAALIILVSGARALWSFARGFFGGTRDMERKDIRRRFGASLLLALDFTIGSDVLKVAQAPNMNRVLVIALVVVVRVLLTFALEYEMKEERKSEKKESGAA